MSRPTDNNNHYAQSDDEDDDEHYEEDDQYEEDDGSFFDEINEGQGEDGYHASDDGEDDDEEGSFIEEDEGSFIEEDEGSFIEEDDGSFIEEDEGSYVEEEEIGDDSFYAEDYEVQDADNDSYVEEEVFDDDDYDGSDDGMNKNQNHESEVVDQNRRTIRTHSSIVMSPNKNPATSIRRSSLSPPSKNTFTMRSPNKISFSQQPPEDQHFSSPGFHTSADTNDDDNGEYYTSEDDDNNYITNDDEDDEQSYTDNDDEEEDDNDNASQYDDNDDNQSYSHEDDERNSGSVNDEYESIGLIEDMADMVDGDDNYDEQSESNDDEQQLHQEKRSHSEQQENDDSHSTGYVSDDNYMNDINNNSENHHLNDYETDDDEHEHDDQQSYESGMSTQEDDIDKQHDERSYDDHDGFDDNNEQNQNDDNIRMPANDYYDDDYGEKPYNDNESGTCSQPYLEDDEDDYNDDDQLDEQYDDDVYDEDELRGRSDDDQQSFDDENDGKSYESRQSQPVDDEYDQKSYQSGQSQESEVEEVNEYDQNQHDDDDDNDDSYNHDDEQSYESGSSSQREYDDEKTFESEAKSKDTQIPYEKVENNGVDDNDDDEDNNLYEHQETDIAKEVLGTHRNHYDNNQKTESHVVSDDDDEQGYEDEYDMDEPDQAYDKHDNKFSNQQNENGSYESEDESQQYDDENDEGEYSGDDNATFISDVIGPPPFVEDDTTDDPQESELEDFKGSEEQYQDNEEDTINSNDIERDSQNSVSYGQSRHSEHLQTSHHMELSSFRSGTSNEVSLYDDEDDDGPIEQFELGPPSYHTLQSDAANKNSTSTHSSIPYSSLTSQPGKLMNLGVNSNFPGYLDKSNSVHSSNSVSPSNCSRSNGDKSRVSRSNTHKSETEESKKSDELFIVNTSNRGAQSNMYFSESRQLSNDFSLDMQILDVDYDNNNIDHKSTPVSGDPASERSSTRSASTSSKQKSPTRGTRRNDSTDSVNLFRVVNKYISNNKNESTSLTGENHEALRNESIGSNRSNYTSGSNHAAAKFEDAGNKRFSFVGSEDGSDFSNENSFEEGDSYDDDDLKGAHSLTSEEQSRSESNIAQQYSVLRDVAMQITTADDLRNEISETSSRSSQKIRETESTKLEQPIAENQSNANQFYDISIDRSSQQNERIRPMHFDRKDSVDSYPTQIYTDSSGYRPMAVDTTSHKSPTSKIEDIVLEEEPRDTRDESNSSASSSPNAISNQNWKEQINATDNLKTKRASAYEVERANAHAQQSMAVISSGGNAPRLSHPWIPTDEKKNVTPLLKQKASTSDNIDTGDVESGIFDPTDNLASTPNEVSEQSPKNKGRKKTPKYVYGTVGIIFLFVFMLLVVLLRKNKNASSPMDLPPVPSPFTPRPSVTSESPTMQPPQTPLPPLSHLIPFVLKSTLTGSSNDVSGFGSSVALYDNTVVVGEPGISTVRSYQTSSNGPVGDDRSVTTDAQYNSQFGQVVDIMKETLVVGAPFLYKAGTTTPAGGVFFYNIDASTQSWTQVGETLYGEDDGEEFGSAVVTSIENRVIVGAARNSGNNENGQVGRVYTYAYDETTQSWMSNELFALVGTEQGDMFGKSVAISRDGTRFIAGAPGTNSSGYVRIYYWIDTRWQLLAVLRGTHENEACGSSVSVLSEIGDYIAIGCPGYNNGAGRVAVYRQLESNGRYVELGSDIVGEPGDNIGYVGGLSGDVGIVGPVVIVAARSGFIRRYDYNDNTNTWNQFYTDVSTSEIDRVVIAFNSGMSTDTLVVGLSGNSSSAFLYEAETLTSIPASSTSIPKPSPSTTAEPTVQQQLVTNTPTTSPVFVSAPTTQPIAAPTTQPIAVPTTAQPLGTPSPITTSTTFAPIPGLNSYPTRSPFAPVPVSVPINVNDLWTLSGGPFEIQSTSSSNTNPNNTLSSGFIPVVALSNSRMVMGSPVSGTVVSFFHQTVTILSIWETAPYQELTGFNEYGASIDMTSTTVDGVDTELLVVGAPGGGGGGTVYCYTVDSSTGDWILYGSNVQSTNQYERFGSTVSISSSTSGSGTNTPRIAIGAPMNSDTNSTLLSRGSVIIYEYDSTITDWKMIETLFGTTSNELFGSAIDICNSGNFVIVGAPGYNNGIGSAMIYQYSTFNWFVATSIIGDSVANDTSVGEQFGSSVCMLSTDGFIVAVGGPYYGNNNNNNNNNNNGRVMVYERNALTGKYTIIGTPIIGDMNENIGLPNSISGTSNLSKTIIQVVVQTKTGLIKLYEYNKSSSVPTWTYKTIVTTSASDIHSIATTSDARSVVVAAKNGIATIYSTPS